MRLMNCFKGEKEKKEDMVVEILNEEYCEDNMVRDLMVLVGKAIDEWALTYGMENLPKSIVFKQAVGILNSLDNTFFKDDDKK